MPSAKTARNSSIDILKFVFSLIIAALHFSISHNLTFARGGYILVEGYFIISGYFFMSAVQSQATCTGKAAATYVFKKYCSFALPLAISAIIGFAVRIAAGEYTGLTALKNLPFLFSEILPLQITGMRTTTSTGVSWYLSAMLLSFLILYPLARKLKSCFVYVFCPLAVCFIYGNLYSRFGNLNPILQTTFGSWITAGLLRAVAAICLGCIIHTLVQNTKKTQLTFAGRAVMSIIVLCCIAGMTIPIFVRPKTEIDYIAVILLFIILFILFSQKSLVSHALTTPKTKLLCDISLLIYLNHSYWATFIAKKFTEYSMLYKIILFISLTVISCCVVNTAVLIIKRLWKKLKPTLKRVFIESET